MNITFSKKPSVKNDQDYYVLYWNDIALFIPKVKYKSILVSKKNKNQYDLFLFTIDDVVISAITVDDEPTKDVFSTKSNHGALETTSEGISLTKNMYGGPVKISTIMLLAYEITPEQLTCNEENRIRESAMSQALILKDIASSDLTAVYKGVGIYNGWITKRIPENFTEYSLTIIPTTIPNQIFNITYKIPKDKIYNELPFSIGNKKFEYHERPPYWLMALNTALKSKTNESWKAFLLAAKQSGISEKSISMTYKNLNLPTP